jgi:hypothetical protein
MLRTTRRVIRAAGAEAAAATAEKLRTGDDKTERPEWTQSDEPVTEESKRVARIAWETYREQCTPWIFLIASLFAGGIVRGNDYGILTILTAPALAAGCYAVTKWRLTQTAVKRKRIDWGQTTGKRIVRIGHRSNRAAAAGFALGVWLFVVAVMPGVLTGLVYAIGFAIWAMAAFGGWWRPIEQAARTVHPTARTRRAPRVPRAATTTEQPHDDEAGEGGHGEAEPGANSAQTAQAPREKPRPRAVRILPGHHLLKPAATRTAGVTDLTATIDALFAAMKVDAHVVSTTRGPIIMRYNVLPGDGVPVRRIEHMIKDLRRKTKSGDLQILAPVPDEDVVGIEVPLPESARRNVTLREVLESLAAAADQHPLLAGFGMQMDGTYVVRRLAELIHILIAGATGSGKSGAVNALLMSILTRAMPDDVRLILIDPKRVELAAYEGIPHLLGPIITNPRKAADKLEWLTREMDLRYDLMAEAGERHIDDYNKKVTGEPLPYLVCVIDELADLMMVAPRDVEEYIIRLLQLGRAAGIILILATQRPSVDVVTGLIKANMPTRWAFKTSSGADSKVILDWVGAEKLAGSGDSLLLPMGSTQPIRLQCVWVSNDERDAVVAYWRGRSPNTPPPASTVPASTPNPQPATDDDIDVDLLVQAAELIVTSQFGSTSMLQRKLRIGYALAGRVMDRLETHRVVGPADGSKARDVLAKPDELEEVTERLRRVQQPAQAKQGVAGTLTARDALLQDIRDLVQYDETREIPYQQIVDATQHMNDKTRDKALGDLAKENPLRLRRVRQGVYQLVGSSN